MGQSSDRLGRKPTLIIGVLGGSVSALALGLSENIFSKFFEVVWRPS